VRLPLLIVLAVVAAAYAGAPNAGFVWDDHAIFEENRALSDPNVADLLLKDLWCCTISPTSPYHRPLLALSFLFDRSLFGLSAGWAHIHSVLWHLMAVTLVATLLRPRVGAPRALLAAAIFGLHPIQSEAVMWISARNDLMVSVGVLATLVTVDQRRPGLAAACAALACLSKESGYLLPVFVLLWRFTWAERPQRTDLGVLVGLGAALLLRSQAMLGGLPEGHVDSGFSSASALNGIVAVLGWVSWPWPLTSTASLYMTTRTAADWLAALATIGGAAAIGRARPRTIGLLVLAFVALAPSAMGVRWYATIGERYLYLPMFGIATAVAVAVPTGRRWLTVGAAGAVAAVVALTIRLPDWATEESLFEAAVLRTPDGNAWWLYAIELQRQGKVGRSMAAYDKALAAEPPHLRSCKAVSSVADEVLPDDIYRSMTERWAGRCAGFDGFDGARTLAFASRGMWDDAARTAIPDREGRDVVVLGALEARDGDLLGLAARGLRWAKGPADLVDLTLLVINSRRSADDPEAREVPAAAGGAPDLDGQKLDAPSP
jgi:hypothetical protein